MKYPEDNLQMAAATYLNYQPKILWCHVANERKTSKIAGARLKKKGVKSGVPDVLIFNPNKNFNGLAIELKIKPNKISDNQKKWLADLAAKGWQTRVAYSLEEFIAIVDAYFR